jgi:hypothetical protein
LDEAIRLSERWAEIAPLATAEAAAQQAPKLSDPAQRTAA